MLDSLTNFDFDCPSKSKSVHRTNREFIITTPMQKYHKIIRTCFISTILNFSSANLRSSSSILNLSASKLLFLQSPFEVAVCCNQIVWATYGEIIIISDPMTLKKCSYLYYSFNFYSLSAFRSSCWSKHGRMPSFFRMLRAEPQLYSNWNIKQVRGNASWWLE